MPDYIDADTGRLTDNAVARLKPELQRALSHSIRRGILRNLTSGPDALTILQLEEGITPVGLSQINYHLQVLVQAGVVACEGSGSVSGRPSYLVTVLDAQALAVLRETQEWDRVQREVASGVTAPQQGVEQ